MLTVLEVAAFESIAPVATRVFFFGELSSSCEDFPDCLSTLTFFLVSDAFVPSVAELFEVDASAFPSVFVFSLEAVSFALPYVLVTGL